MNLKLQGSVSVGSRAPSKEGGTRLAGGDGMWRTQLATGRGGEPLKRGKATSNSMVREGCKEWIWAGPDE